MADRPDGTLSPRTIFLLALSCGVSVANIYFPQAISPLIADGLHVSDAQAARVVTANQAGYAVGIFLLVPLGDRIATRRLVGTLLGLVSAGLLVAGTAPSLPVLVAASALVGVTTVVPQIIIATSVGLVPEARRGAVTGTLLSGLLGGILLARTFGGALGTWLGWRAPYLVAAALMLALAAALTGVLPTARPASRQRYPALVAAAPRLLRAEPALRRSCLFQSAALAGFSAAWTSLTLYLTSSAYGLGTVSVGVIALVGAASMLVTPRVGRLVDRRGPGVVSVAAMGGSLAAAALLLTGCLGGALGLIGLTAGMLLLDVAVQSGQVANQSRVFALAPAMRSRLNTAYMSCVFLGGSAGSWLGVTAYDQLGWPGVCLLLAGSATLALLAAATLGTTAGPRASKHPRVSDGCHPTPAEPAWLPDSVPAADVDDRLDGQVHRLDGQVHRLAPTGRERPG
ncbi:MFS transporter [Frankia sp. AgPm24]|uniref:MFS transporter n=1 Tax=Frankia sp. AgPm24 TaxID=631128 RepID=UPI0020102509|nr:MFS transporter [Frankia sp. AgPm24]MCK9924184.1 MFS transporter [Frankia sp. AgPm24]